MKFTSEDLMKAMGLNVGDRVKINNYKHIFTIRDDEFEIKDDDGNLEYKNPKGKIMLVANDMTNTSLIFLLNTDFEILPRPKRVGDLKCEEFECLECPLRCICPWDREQYEKETLYEVVKCLQVVKSDQEIYDLLKARLDKVGDE